MEFMDEPFANIQATSSPYSLENLFDIDDLLPYQDDSNFSQSVRSTDT